MDNVVYDSFNAEQSFSSDILIWIFKKYPGGMLEHPIQLYFDFRNRRWSAYQMPPGSGRSRRIVDAEELADMLPEEERARAMSAAVTGRVDW